MLSMSHKAGLLWAVSLSFAVPAFTQDSDADQTKLDTIIVNGSRLSQTETEVGSSVTVITAEDIEEFGFDFALDAVAAVPGVTTNSNGAFGGTASVRIRGASSGQTLVLVDGVVVNDPTSPGGGFNFARFDTENIERIEVLKGPQSNLWGTDAIGGVISITTKIPDLGLGGSVFGEYGSFNTFRSGASVENADDTGDFRLAVVSTTSDGVSKADEDNGNSEDDAYKALTFSAKASYNLHGDARLSADVLWIDAESEYDSFSSNAQGSVADGDEVSETKEQSANISFTGSLLEGRLENLVLIGHSDITRENFSNGASSFNSEGNRTIYRYQGTFSIDQMNTVAFGAEREESTSNDDDSSIDGLFALYENKPVETLTLTGGIRVDNHQQFGSETTARVATAYNPDETLTFRLSSGQGFKAPTIFQTTYFCCGATSPNAELKAENSQAFDIGVDWRLPDGRAEAGITYFDQNTENQIGFSFGVGGYENIAVVNSRGFELYASLQLNDWLNISADYAYIDAKDGDGKALARIPKHSGDVTVIVDPTGPFSGSVLVRHNGAEPNTNNTMLDGWTRVDLACSYDLNDRVELFGRIENHLNEKYQQILGYGTPDLSGYLGFRLRY